MIARVDAVLHCPKRLIAGLSRGTAVSWSPAREGGSQPVSETERSGGAAAAQGTRKRSRRGVGGQGAQRRSKGPKERQRRGVRGARRPSAARGSGGPEGLSATPTAEPVSDERSEEGNAGRRQSPLCPFLLTRGSGASATDRGHNCCCDQGKRVVPDHLVPDRNPEDAKRGLVPGPPFCPGKSGFGWYPGLRRLDAGVPDMERSDVGGGEACGTRPVSTLTQTRGRGCLWPTAAQVGASRRPLWLAKPKAHRGP